MFLGRMARFVFTEVISREKYFFQTSMGSLITVFPNGASAPNFNTVCTSAFESKFLFTKIKEKRKLLGCELQKLEYFLPSG